jgi:putative hydrolase of the HAD superfamily
MTAPDASALCVVFDIDDTLYLERDYVVSGFAATGPWAQTWLGIPDFAERCRGAFESGLRGSIFNLVLEECGQTASPETVAALLALYRSHTPSIRLCEDARHALEQAAALGPVGVITDGPAIAQTRKAEALRLHRYASPIFPTELFGAGRAKPNPFAFLKVQEAHPSRKYVYIADNPAKDFHAPAQLGWHSIRIRRPGGLHFAAENAEVKPDFELPDCAGVIAILAELR